MKQITLVKIAEINSPPRDIRTIMQDSALEDLTASIKQMGVLQPIILNKQGENLYIISGHRRLIAADAAGLIEIPATIMQISDEDVEIMRLHENLFREDLSPIDQAQSLLYLEQHYHLTREKIATLMGKTKGWVTQRIDILSWSDEIKIALSGKLISFSIGRELAKVEDAQEQKRLLVLAVESGATVRVISTWVTEWQQKQMKSADQITQEEKDQVYKDVLEIKINPCFACLNPDPKIIHVIGICDQCYDALQPPSTEQAEKKPDAAADKIT